MNKNKLQNVKLLAFYLPQYHPIPENDEWWGKGFTEWTNVTTARPRFNGHYQPKVPADLGYYDLRSEDIRNQQAKMAKDHGIYGFCYYHYWFNGKMLLEKPFNDVLESGEPQFPFCLCWANENWTRAWDGLEREILIQQEYTPEDSDKHIAWFANAFKDERYIKVNGKPLLLIYRYDKIPDVDEVIKSWRGGIKAHGFDDIYICAVKTGFVDAQDEDILGLGFDAIIDFQPDRNDFPPPVNIKGRLYNIARKLLPDFIYQWLKLSVSANNVVDYTVMIKGLMDKQWPKNFRKFPCVFPSWDNSARRKTAIIIQNNDPDLYKEWLEDAIHKVSLYPEPEQFVFLNAWNEWAEGCYLEPDKEFGHAFLEKTKQAVEKSNQSG